MPGFDKKSKWITWAPFFKLRDRLQLLGALILLPAFGFVLYATLEQRHAATDQARDRALSLLQLAALDQKHLVRSTRQQLVTLSQLPMVRDPALARQCNETFFKLRKQYHYYNNIGVADTQGWMYCSGAPLTKPVNIADRDYFQAAVAKRDFSISDYQIGRVIKRAVIVFAYPVMDDAGRVRSVVFASIDLASWFKELASGTSLPPKASLLLINNKGMILAHHPNPEQWMGKIVTDSPLTNAIKAGAKNGRIEEVGLDGVKRLFVFTQVQDVPAGEVYLVAGIPSANLYADANKIFWSGLIGILLVAASIGTAAWVGGTRLILSPVLALTRAVKQLGQGNLRARTRLPHGRDELGQLAQAFDQMAASLQEKDELLTTVGGMAKVGGWEFHVDTGKGSWTPEVARIHDMTPLEATNMEIGLTFYQGESKQKIEDAIRNAVQHAQPYDLELEMVSAKGNHKWVRTIGQPVMENNHVVKVRGSFQDISEHKRAAEEIRRLNADLERKVIERTIELEVANRELEAFSYSVSHDLRAPLRTIDGFSQAIIEDCSEQLDEQSKGHLIRVRAATQHMGHLIDDLLKLAQVTRAEINREVVDLSALAKSVRANLASLSDERQVDWHIEAGLVATGDAHLLRVVLDNLLGNAWKFTSKKNSARVEFGTLQLADGKQAYFVRDNGVGFDMKYASKLFGAFQRLHNVKEFPGTGIGLATVQRVIHRHSGRIWADSVAGKGATFYFLLG